MSKVRSVSGIGKGADRLVKGRFSMSKGAGVEDSEVIFLGYLVSHDSDLSRCFQWIILQEGLGA